MTVRLGAFQHTVAVLASVFFTAIVFAYATPVLPFA